MRQFVVQAVLISFAGGHLRNSVRLCHVQIDRRAGWVVTIVNSAFDTSGIPSFHFRGTSLRHLP